MPIPAHDDQLMQRFDRIAATCDDTRLETGDRGWRVVFERRSGEVIDRAAPRLLDAVEAAVDEAQQRGWVKPEPA